LASLLLTHPKNARQEILAERATSAANFQEKKTVFGWKQRQNIPQANFGAPKFGYPCSVNL